MLSKVEQRMTLKCLYIDETLAENYKYILRNNWRVFELYMQVVREETQ